MTVLNAVKPAVIDDVVYWQYAKQIAAAPTDPYGFEISVYDRPVPANEIVAPPVLLYWLAGAIELFGDRPWAWKLALAPFAFALCLALWSLLGRLGVAHRTPMLVLAVVSPALLPALNLMLDIPAAALGTTALALLVTASDREDHVGLALLAGLVGGLAMQTKYVAVLPFAAGLLFALMQRRWRTAFAAGAVAAASFIGWEIIIWARYGASHFLTGLETVDRFVQPSWPMRLVAYGCLLGSASLGTIPFATMLRSRAAPVVAASMACVGTGVAAIAFLPPEPIARTGPTYPSPGSLEPDAGVLLALGLAVVVALGVGVHAIVVRGQACEGAPVRSSERRLDLFVFAWIALEVVGVFWISPFPALRRMVGLHLALVVGLARFLQKVDVSSRSSSGAAAFAAALGLIFAVADLGAAHSRERAATTAVRRLDVLDPDPRAHGRWFLAHWGFELHARRAGLRAVDPGTSRLRRGDWVLIPNGVFRPTAALPSGALELVDTVTTRASWPWNTHPGAYAGHRPLRPQPEAQVQVRIFRVTADFVPGPLTEHR